MGTYIQTLDTHQDTGHTYRHGACIHPWDTYRHGTHIDMGHAYIHGTHI
jgi:hypothetical protein